MTQHIQTIHLVLLGDSGAGKTVFCNLLESGQFCSVVGASIGTEVYTYVVNNSVKFIVYDIACKPAYVRYMSTFLRKADAALIFHDATKEVPQVDWLDVLRTFNKSAKVFHVRAKCECPTKTYDASFIKSGTRLGDLALSQNPDLDALFTKISAQFRKGRPWFHSMISSFRKW
jgi:GTPase SAR1 family protein